MKFLKEPRPGIWVAVITIIVLLVVSGVTTPKATSQAAPVQTRIFVSEEDGSPRARVREFKFSNGSLTLNANGTASIAGGGGGTGTVYTAGTGLTLTGSAFSFDAASSPSLTALTLSGLTNNRALFAGTGGLLRTGAATESELGWLVGTTNSIQTQLNAMMLRAGSTMTGQLLLYADPTNTLAAATKQYVDALAASTASRTFTNVTILATNRGSEFFPAAEWTPTTGSGSSSAATDYSTTNLTTRATINFPAAGTSRASFVWAPPQDYDGEAYITIYHARDASPGGAVVWNIGAQSFPSGSQVTAAMSAGVTATNNATGVAWGMISHPSSGPGYGPLTVDAYAEASPPNPIVFRITRNGDSASDDAGITYAWGARINYKKKATLANP